MMSKSANFILLISLIHWNLVIGYKCKFDKDYVCNINPDSSGIIEQHLPNKSDSDVGTVEINGTLNGISHLTGSELAPFCKRFSNLFSVEIYGEIKAVDQDLFENCKNLMIIDFAYTDIEKIPENLFFENLKLKSLYLYKNQLTELPENVFVNQRKLEILHLWRNKIQQLPPNIFKSLDNLKNLFLGGNQISELPKNVFKPLKNLKQLSMWGNRLTTLHADSFGVHEKLTIIDLRTNKIISIDEEVIDNTAIKVLNMEGNKCSNKYVDGTEKMKEELQQCFENYEPREDDFNDAINCGKSRMWIGVRSISAHGNAINHGEYPWNVALVTNNGDFFCGGTIISSKFVVTAAFCIKGKHESHVFKATDFKVLLGVHDLTRENESGRITAVVKSIRIHPHWSTNSPIYEANLALLELHEEIEFNNLIQPICLANKRSQLDKIVNATVAGFGRGISGEMSKIARQLDIRTKSYHDCIRDSYDHQEFMTTDSFCGKSNDRHGICDGDSGSGLYVLKNGKYFLGGIVSFSLRNEMMDCDTAMNAVFTDATRFYDWLRSGGLKKYAY